MLTDQSTKTTKLVHLEQFAMYGIQLLLVSPFRIPIHIPFPRLRITKCHELMIYYDNFYYVSSCAPSQRECVPLMMLKCPRLVVI